MKWNLLTHSRIEKSLKGKMKSLTVENIKFISQERSGKYICSIERNDLLNANYQRESYRGNVGRGEKWSSCVTMTCTTVAQDGGDRAAASEPVHIAEKDGERRRERVAVRFRSCANPPKGKGFRRVLWVENGGSGSFWMVRLGHSHYTLSALIKCYFYFKGLYFWSVLYISD